MSFIGNFGGAQSSMSCFGSALKNAEEMLNGGNPSSVCWLEIAGVTIENADGLAETVFARDLAFRFCSLR